MEDYLTTNKVAALLGTSRPTVLNLIEKKVLIAEREPRGTRFRWLIERGSAEAHLAVHGRYDVRRTDGKSRLERIEQDLSSLLERFDQLTDEIGVAVERGASPRTARELADIRARNVNLEEALTRSHAALDLQREAASANADERKYLRDALSAADRADELQRQANEELGEAVRGFTRPGHIEGVK